MEDPVVINKIARFYAPAKTLKDGYRRSKIKAKKASATKSTATTEAELFSRISKYSNTALPAQHADFQNACATLLDPLMNEAREKPYDELAASVLDALCLIRLIDV
ncbi:hypothetical protein BV898_15468 [Hypsibius exemplaris]|uniref:Uncharacterized protein n=1 Tax=Hypsibius exemplaris TaxID=2072580 RepID=A0A9X6NB09_HYPEX|nr:hypothetical protein BV898_15468 [Hypsibius exemplaris]